MLDPEPRAALYLDYQHVTKHHTMESWVNLPGPIGDYLRASSKRTEGEKRNLAEYNRVRSEYALKKDPNRVRSHWYPGNLREIAGKVNRTPEYDAVYRLYSAWAHGDSWTADLLKVGHVALWQVLGYWARILLTAADRKRIVLAAEDYEPLAELAKGITA